jgi:NADH-quinone oxidoreductase subunit D
MTLKSEPVIINIGPQHPSMHGVFRLRVAFDGEEVVDAEPVIGYLHRGTEKLAETRNYTQIVTLTDRMDYVASMSNNLGYVRAVEELAGIEVPERAQYLRVISAELQRIASHLMGIGFFLNDLGALATPLMYCFRERERILDLFEMLCGARITLSYMRPGGVTQDAPEDFWPALRKLNSEMPGYIDELEGLISTNEIVLTRTLNVGIITPEQAIAGSMSGPMLRATGVQWDLRRAHPYEIYDRLTFDIPIGSNGDSFDRYLVRIQEMRESVKIIDQCIRDIPEGPARNEDVPFMVRPPVGDVYSSIEGPKGELGFYLVSDGGISPYRCHVRAPSFINLSMLREMLVGWKMADLIIIFGSIDVVLGEIDR